MADTGGTQINTKDLQDLIEKTLEELEEPKAKAETVGAEDGDTVTRSVIDFNMKPEELESYLNKYVVGQQEAIEVIATKVCTHFNRMKIEQLLSEEERMVGSIKSNILMIGPTGVGKTYIIKLIAKRLGVPFVKADATKFSETGYVGGDVEDLVRELVHEADGDIARAEYGIIYLDEIDKIASSKGLTGPDVSRGGVQRNLLKLMEEAEVDLKTPHDLASQVEAAMEAQRTGKVTRKKINTRNILFIVSGAFSGMLEIIRRRQNLQAIGFASEHAPRRQDYDAELLKKVRTEDLIEFGFESEFVGRLPVTVVLNDVTEDTLYKILNNRYSTVVNGKKMDFKAYGIDLDFTDGALRTLAKMALGEKTGARGLLNVFEKTLICFEKTLPSLTVDTLLVDEDTVADPRLKLRSLMVHDSLKSYQSSFLARHGIYLEFTSEAIDLIEEKVKAEQKSFTSICEDLFHDYAYGIRLMQREEYTITADAVRNPVETLEEDIRRFMELRAASGEPMIRYYRG